MFLRSEQQDQPLNFFCHYTSRPKYNRCVPLSAAFLLICSAILHAAWNLASKRNLSQNAALHPNGSSVATMFAANLAGCALFFPLIWLPPWPILHLPEAVWLCLAVTGAFEALYYVALTRAYQSGDLSVAYPLARAVPALLVAGLTWLGGWGEPLRALTFIGVISISLGCLLIPLDAFSAIRWELYRTPSVLWALTAAAGTAGYSLVDGTAMQILGRLSGSDGLGSLLQLAALYGLLQGVSTLVWLLFFLATQPGERQALASFGKRQWRGAVGIGAGIYLAYALVLLAMSLVTNVSYVVALRQLSIPLGALAGMLLLHEPAHPPRLVGLALAFWGLILLGL